MRSFENIKCISPASAVEEGKHIEIWPRGWPNFNTGARDLREKYDFVTVPAKPSPGTSRKGEENMYRLQVKHEVPRDKILAAQVQRGERYRVSLTDKGSGTYWWMFGKLEDVEGMRFKSWRETESEGEDMGNDKLEKNRRLICPLRVRKRINWCSLLRRER